MKKTHATVAVESYLVSTHEFMTLDINEDPATYYTRNRLPQFIAKVNRLSMGDIPYLPALEKARTRYVVRWLNRKKFARTVLNKE